MPIEPNEIDATTATRPPARGMGVLISRSQNLSEVDGRVLKLFESRGLRNRLALERTNKINLGRVWHETESWLVKSHQSETARSEPIETHYRVVNGLQGVSLFIAAAMLWDSMEEARHFYDLTTKTLRSRLTDLLTAQEGELALRAGRVTEAAAGVFGTYDSARKWLRTPNFALGGLAPRDLLKTAEGERIVLNELQTQSEGGPL